LHFVVEDVGDQEPPVGGRRHPGGLVELGAGSRAVVAGVPGAPVPVTRVITPAAETLRTTLLPLSAIRNPPSGVTATPKGLLGVSI
jgi:hypothetical protein